MSQQHGGITLEVGGQSFRLVLDINALCELEELLSTTERAVTFQEVLAKAATGSLRHTRALLWAALLRHHPGMTLTEVGGWIEDVGLDVLLSKFDDLAGSARPDTADAKELGVKRGRPRGARAVGTGGRLNSTPVAPA